jgi:hypothetical protein
MLATFGGVLAIPIKERMRFTVLAEAARAKV